MKNVTAAFLLLLAPFLWAESPQTNQNEADIAALDDRVSENETDIASNDGNIVQNTSDIVASDARISTLEAQPPGASQSQVDDHELRIAALEAGGPLIPVGASVLDVNGTFLGAVTSVAGFKVFFDVQGQPFVYDVERASIVGMFALPAFQSDGVCETGNGLFVFQVQPQISGFSFASNYIGFNIFTSQPAKEFALWVVGSTTNSTFPNVGGTIDGAGECVNNATVTSEIGWGTTSNSQFIERGWLPLSFQ